MKKKEYEAQQQLVIKQLSVFSRCYDLQSLGHANRQEETKAKITLLQDQKLLLETGTV